ncbi:hypothetical protein BD413DRAFT_617570 [Trametes elegans]|nr:hypothetical protein BD413DRAFT_617570 [Trametes elegans]
MFSTKLVAAFAALLAAAATARAADTGNIIRPAIVKWAVPAELATASSLVDIRLGYQYANGEGQHWHEFRPLATNVNFTDAAAVVAVPRVEPKGVYMVQVGDSPDYTSPKFLIKPVRT